MAFVCAGKVVVDDDIVGALKGTAIHEDEGLECVVAGEVDAPDSFNRARGAEVGDDGSDDGDVGNLAEYVGDFDGGGGSADTGHEAGIGGAHDHVGADAADAGFLIVEHAVHDGDDREDHDDFNGDGEDADGGTKGPVEQIVDDELVHSL